MKFWISLGAKSIKYMSEHSHNEYISECVVLSDTYINDKTAIKHNQFKQSETESRQVRKILNFLARTFIHIAIVVCQCNASDDSGARNMFSSMKFQNIKKW